MKTRTKIIIALISAIVLIPYLVFVMIYHTHYSMLTQKLIYTPNLPSIVYDLNGEVITELFDEMRTPADFDEIPVTVIQAFTSAEDKNFYDHNGLDFLGMLRALIIDIRAGEVRQGGSTITQQLIKQLYTTGERTIDRKVMEILLVKKIEEKYSKEEILVMYLNQIYFGHGVYGIKSAADFFFNKDVSSLTLMEASLLALIPPAPNRYSPLRNPGLAKSKQRQILLNLVKNGYLKRSEAAQRFGDFWIEYTPAFLERYPTEVARSQAFDKAPYVSEYIRKILIKQYGKRQLYQGGMKIHTTIDLKQQKIATQHLQEQIARQRKIAATYNYKLLTRMKKKSFNIEKSDKVSLKAIQDFDSELLFETEFISLLSGSTTIPEVLEKHRHREGQLERKALVEGAFVSVEPDTGNIRALVGGSKFTYENQLNRATLARRQPGSSFKPFAYAAGIDSKKITAATAFEDLPMVFNERTKSWAPSNASNKFSGTILVRKAITRSVNTIAVLAFEAIGGELIADYASKMIGIPKSRFEVDPTLALGSSEVTPLELATGFSCFANGGYRCDPHIIEKIIDYEGNEIYSYSIKKQSQPISAGTAYIMNSILQEVVINGTATSTVRYRYGFTGKAGGKTGTNTDYRDAWFAGFTPDLIAVVWIGCDSQLFTLGSGQYGANAAAPVWAKFMNETRSIRRNMKFPGRPASVTSHEICSYSGMLPRTSCPHKSELFLKGTVPDKVCSSSHQTMQSLDQLIKNKTEE